MARIFLVTGGCRSGKSRHALDLAETMEGRRLFVATCQATDQEMLERVRAHQKARKHSGWETVEEPIDIAEVLKSHEGYHVVVVDCLTLWIGNLMYTAQNTGYMPSEPEVEEAAASLLEACRRRAGAVVFVTNEVGMGLVPDNFPGRRFRDLTGRCNQVVSSGADKVVCMISGLPIILKG